MSRPDAAALTAALMARKGAAQPSRLFAVAAPVAAPRAPHAAPPAAPGKGRRRLTLRLDPDRHLRLKLAAAHLGCSLQDVVVTALDAHLAREAPCACLAAEPE